MVRGNVWKSWRFMLERSEEVQHPDAQPCCRSGPSRPQWRMFLTTWRRVCGTSSPAAWSKTRPSGQQHNRCWLTRHFSCLVSLCDVSAAQRVCGVSATWLVCVVVCHLLDQCVCGESVTWSVCAWCVSYLISVCSGVSPTSSVCVWCVSYLVSVCVVCQLLDQCVHGVSATWSVCV